MTTPAGAPPAFVRQLVRDLQARQFAIGYDDLLALRSALRAGFGLASRDHFVELCVALWAKSGPEAAVVRMLLARQELAEWGEGPAAATAGTGNAAITTAGPTRPTSGPPTVPVPVETPGPAGHERLAGVPRLPVATARGLVLALQFPLTGRTVAQAIRRLRRPVRSGPATELDVEATVARRARTGVASPPVLVPRRRNLARLLLLVDRQGSMSPLHPYLDHLRDAIVHDGRLEKVWVSYLHDTPVDRADKGVLARLEGLFPRLDAVLADIAPSTRGFLFDDPELRRPRRISAVLDGIPGGVGVVVLSDTGALRGNYDPERLVASVAFARELRRRGHRLVWLNPVPRRQWAGTSAAELARHVPMFALDRLGLHRAVEALQGRPVPLERPA